MNGIPADRLAGRKQANPGPRAASRGRARPIGRYQQSLCLPGQRHAESAAAGDLADRYTLNTEVIRRRNQYRTITVSAVPQSGILASRHHGRLLPKVKEFAKHLPAGYRLEVGGEQEKQDHGNGELIVVLAVSVVAIYLALAIQFKNALKPLIVLAAVPYGAVGALAALAIMGAPFGFMAFLGVISLVGVIVSHIIVLFDYIEEKHKQGEPFEEAILDAGIMRLRPVLVTVGATVMALVPSRRMEDRSGSPCVTRRSEA